MTRDEVIKALRSRKSRSGFGIVDDLHHYFREAKAEGRPWDWVDAAAHARELIYEAFKEGAYGEGSPMDAVVEAACAASYYGALAALADTLGFNREKMDGMSDEIHLLSDGYPVKMTLQEFVDGLLDTELVVHQIDSGQTR